MKSIEQAAELHQALAQLAPHPGGLLQGITTSQGWASNQERQSMNFQSLIAPGDIPRNSRQRNAFAQGFGCVEINILARWGGCHHDGSPRDGTEVTVHVLDRLGGGMATRTWYTHDVGYSQILPDDEIIPLVRELLGLESLASLAAKQADQEEKNTLARAEFEAFLRGE